jgi:hypothetical protein
MFAIMDSWCDHDDHFMAGINTSHRDSLLLLMLVNDYTLYLLQTRHQDLHARAIEIGNCKSLQDKHEDLLGLQPDAFVQKCIRHLSELNCEQLRAYLRQQLYEFFVVAEQMDDDDVHELKSLQTILEVGVRLVTDYEAQHHLIK